MGEIMALSQAELLEQMKGCVEKLGAIYKEHSFRATSMPVQSGYCLIEGQLHFIMDKRKKPRDKLRILAKALANLDLESVHIPPDVREAIGQLVS